VALLDPKNTWQMVAIHKISGLWGIDTFYGNLIPKFSLKVDVSIVHVVDVPFMHPHEPDE
jgi:hypothetical protein